jgi:hypothetical protein
MVAIMVVVRRSIIPWLTVAILRALLHPAVPS